MLEINGLNMTMDGSELTIKCRPEGGYLSFEEWVGFLRMRTKNIDPASIKKQFGSGYFPSDKKFLNLFLTMLYWDEYCVEVREECS